MTVTSDLVSSIQDEFLHRHTERRAAKEKARAEVEAMSQAMIQEQGLLNHVQAGLLLDVSTKRIGELTRLGRLTRFDFMGRTYVSVREVRARRDEDVKAGRPARNLMKRVLVGLAAAAETDAEQAKLGGFAGPYVKEQHRQSKAKTKPKKS